MLKKEITIFVFLFIIIDLLFFSQKTAAQISQSINAGNIKELHKLNLTKHSDQIAGIDKCYLDSLVQRNIKFSDSINFPLNGIYYSCVQNKNDVLSQVRKDSLSFLYNNLIQKYKGAFDKWKLISQNSFTTHIKKLNSLQKKFYCQKCAEKDEFDDMLEQFIELADSLHYLFQDNISTTADDIIDELKDINDNSRDSLKSYYASLTDNQNDENEMIKENESSKNQDMADQETSRFVVSSDYDDHFNYRSRDNGNILKIITPSLAYHHKSGLSVSGSLSLVTNIPDQVYDNFTMSIGYEKEFSDLFTGSLSYSHYWFSENSIAAKSVISNSIDCDLYFGVKSFFFDVETGVDIGQKSEYTFNLSPGYSGEIGNLFGSDKINFQAMVSAIYGVQDATLTSLRLHKNKKNVTEQKTTKNSRAFSVLGYEPSISFNYESGNFIFKPALEYIIPLNVIDNSQTQPFFNFTFGVSYTIR